MRTNKLNLRREIKNLNKAIAMKCLDCVCCQAKEVLRCQITGCPLWNLRPKRLKGLYTIIRELKKKNPGYYQAES
ncbi:MAG TPA: hypothetical protein VJ044_02095 [Candidatus Hodarchaeales archaeon]|nr:hypothetical protein [Candidatus Hodarchaeales archaeon]